MLLRVQIPEADAVSNPVALSLIRWVPATYVEREGEDRVRVAVFANLPKSLDVAIRLIGEAVEMPRARVSVNDRPVASINKLWSALNCYRESLAEPDRQAYCARRAATVSDVGACPGKACISHCQFICTRCLQVSRELGAPPVSAQLHQIAVQAEVDWCPNLRLAHRA